MGKLNNGFYTKSTIFQAENGTHFHRKLSFWSKYTYIIPHEGRDSQQYQGVLHVQVSLTLKFTVQDFKYVLSEMQVILFPYWITGKSRLDGTLGHISPNFCWRVTFAGAYIRAEVSQFESLFYQLLPLWPQVTNLHSCYLPGLSAATGKRCCTTLTFEKCCRNMVNNIGKNQKKVMVDVYRC